jgi:hypothetical protein
MILKIEPQISIKLCTNHQYIQQFLVIIVIIKLILLKIRVRTVKFQIYEWQRATVSGAFHYFYKTRHCQWRVCFLYIQNVQRLSISLARGLNETRH